MPFVKNDPRRGPGGRRPGAGRPSREATQKKLAAAEIARALLESEITPIVQEYTRLASGGLMRKGQSPQTTRHAVERFIPAAKQFLHIDVETGFEKLIADLEAEELIEKEAQAKAHAVQSGEPVKSLNRRPPK
jgi:hypothetical protein